MHTFLKNINFTCLKMLVNNYLMINEVVETDAGEYICSARDHSGCFAKVSAYLTVETVGHGRGESTFSGRL